VTTDQPAAADGDDSIKIGVYVEGNFWFHLAHYWLHEHEMRVKLRLDGVQDAIRWYAREAFGRPVQHTRIHRSHFVHGPKSTLSPAYAKVLDRLGVTRHHMAANPTNNRVLGVRAELILLCYDDAYYDDLDMVALITGDDEYRPLVDRLVAEKVKVLIPQIETDFTDNRTGDKRWLATSSHLCGAATDAPSYEELLRATETDQYAERNLTSPFLWEENAINRSDRAVRTSFRGPDPRRRYG
jgi:hypothetical protein